MRILKIILALLLVVEGGAPLLGQATQPGSSMPPVRARMTTVVDNFLGIGGETPEVRLVFARTEQELCLTIAVQPGPRALRAQLFQFSKRDEAGSTIHPLKFKLPKKGYRPEGQEDRVRVWDACTTASALDESEDQLSILIQYRDPRNLRELAKYTLPFPEMAMNTGADIHKDSAGNLLFRGYATPNTTTKKRLPE